MKTANTLAQAEALKGKIIEWRRHFHENPELSFQEHNTVQFVKEKLEALNFEIEYPLVMNLTTKIDFFLC